MKHIWYGFAITLFILSLGCIVNGSRNSSECEETYQATCDGKKLTYCYIGRCVGTRCEDNEIKTVNCAKGCEVGEYGTNYCYQDCKPDTDQDTCVSSSTVKTCTLEYGDNVQISKFVEDKCLSGQTCKKEEDRAFCFYE